MSLIYINVIDRCNIPVESCDTVYLCLVPGWAEFTKTGLPFAEARVTRVSKYVTPNTVENCCTTTTICAEECIYQLEINDDQFDQDPLTGEPYLITCNDVSEIIPYDCFAGSLVDILATGGDRFLDYDNVTIAANAASNVNTLTLPVVAGVPGGTTTPVGSAVVSIPAGTLTFNGSTISYESGAGDTASASVCDLFENCIDDITITRNGATGLYEATPTTVPGFFTNIGAADSGTDQEQYSGDNQIIYQGPRRFLNNDVCGSPGPNEWLYSGISISGTAWTWTRVPEHTALAETAVFASQSYSTPTAINSLKTSDSTVRSPAYVEATFTNPSSCRSMDVMIIATGSFAASSTIGSGFVVWGHSLWINGSLVSTRNGRSDAGWNIAWGDGTGFLQDYTLAPFVYEWTIPAGGSITIGLDFGDSDTFISVGETTSISIESRQIAVVGSTN